VAGKLQKELKQAKPFAGIEEEVFLNLLRTADALSRPLAEMLKRAGLTPTQYNVLRILRGAGECGAACREISDRLITKDPDITRLLDRMEDRGLVTREREERDRRRIATRITDEGLRLLAEWDGRVEELLREQLGHMDEKKLARLNELLEAARGDGA